MGKDRHLSFDYIRIRQIRESRNLSQTAVARQLGISQSSYNDLEQGRTKLKAEMLPRMAQSMKVDICCFFEPVDIPPKEDIGMPAETIVPEKQYTLLQKENERMTTLLSEQLQLYKAYRQRSEELLVNMRRRLRINKSFIKILLLCNVSILYLFIIINYFEELYLWILSFR